MNGFYWYQGGPMAERIKSFTVRLPERLLKRIEEQARVLRRSRNAQITHMLEQTLDRQDQTYEDALKVLSDRMPD